MANTPEELKNRQEQMRRHLRIRPQQKVEVNGTLRVVIELKGPDGSSLLDKVDVVTMLPSPFNPAAREVSMLHVRKVMEMASENFLRALDEKIRPEEKVTEEAPAPGKLVMFSQPDHSPPDAVSAMLSMSQVKPKDADAKPGGD